MANQAKRSSNSRARSKSKRWSAHVTERSNALDLEPKVFRSSDPHKIALSLKRSAQHSKRRKGTPYQSAMSMLNFYINRAGKNLPQKRKRVLERAKDELRDVFGRTEQKRALRSG
ncbi:MAG: hypothetical protein DME45_11790 [Verrucomicrobia bacterium]|nr:MAG: hypothetical protein DME45_11790 [Verrucomicrobiota bacterium]PYK75527.1 MAG: hypothetical protein DME42_02325 [Verrucomicrobiota bacterium]